MSIVTDALHQAGYDTIALRGAQGSCGSVIQITQEANPDPSQYTEGLFRRDAISLFLQITKKLPSGTVDHLQVLLRQYAETDLPGRSYQEGEAFVYRLREELKRLQRTQEEG